MRSRAVAEHGVRIDVEMAIVVAGTEREVHVLSLGLLERVDAGAIESRRRDQRLLAELVERGPQTREAEQAGERPQRAVMVVHIGEVGLRQQSQPHGSRRVIFELLPATALVPGRYFEPSGAQR